jgi:sphingolipid 8-(E)-desaturase
MAYDAFARIFLPLQHKLYYIVMSLARFNLYANSYTFLALKARRDWTFFLELFGLVVFWTWYSLVLRGTGSWATAIGYLLVSHMVASPLHIQVSKLVHIALPCHSILISS